MISVRLFVCAAVTILSMSTRVSGMDESTPRQSGVVLYSMKSDATPRQRQAVRRVLSDHGPSRRARRLVAGTTNPLFHKLQFDPGSTARQTSGVEESVARELLATGGVAFAEPDYLIAPAALPNDPSYADQWHHAAIQAPAAWDVTTGNPEVVLAVLDTGIQSDHPDLSAILRLPGRNTVDNSQNTEPNSATSHFHGTQVAGCAAAAGNNGTGGVGIAWSIRVLPVKITNRDDGQSFLSDIAEGIQWSADQGARVINISYGVANSPVIDSAAAYARDLGALTIMAAGNDNMDISSWPDRDSVVVVGSTTSSQTKSSFSNYGTPVDLVAPGSTILTTTLQGGYSYASGTSLASPICAGVAALVLSVNPTLTPAEVESILFDTADDLGEAGDDDVYGHGRVNALAAVQAARTGGGGRSAPVAMISPANGSTLNDASTTFQWSSGRDVEAVSLWIGSRSGASDVYSASHGTAGPAEVSGLPVDGRSLYVRLWSRISGVWLYNDYTYTAAGTRSSQAVTKATVAHPANNSTLDGSSQRFTIDRGSGVESASLWIGSRAGAYDIVATPLTNGSLYYASGLPTDGRTIHLTLWSLVNGVWESSASTYTAGQAGNVEATVVQPLDNTILSGTSQLFTIDRGSGAEGISIWIGTTAGGNDIATHSMGSTSMYIADDLPDDGSLIHVTVWSRIDGSWRSNAYTYRACRGCGL